MIGGLRSVFGKSSLFSVYPCSQGVDLQETQPKAWDIFQSFSSGRAINSSSGLLSTLTSKALYLFCLSSQLMHLSRYNTCLFFGMDLVELTWNFSTWQISLAILVMVLFSPQVSEKSYFFICLAKDKIGKSAYEGPTVVLQYQDLPQTPTVP